MEQQTINWCMSLPNNKKNINKMKMVFVGGKAIFVPTFLQTEKIGMPSPQSTCTVRV